MLVATLFIVPVLSAYGQTGVVEKFPTLIVCGFTYLVAFLSLFTGLVLSNLNKKEKQDFEWKLVQLELMKNTQESIQGLGEYK